MKTLRSWGLPGRASIALALALMGAAAVQSSASASVIEGWRHSWDTGPVFATDPSGVGRILFSRDTVAPQAGEPYGRIMNSTIDGSYVGFQMPPMPGRPTDITVPGNVDRFAYTGAQGVCNLVYQEASAALVNCDYGADSSDPDYSEDGKQLAYVKAGRIHLDRPWSPEPVVIGSPPGADMFTARQPAFALYGERVVFAAEGSDSGQILDGIWSAPTDGTGSPTRLTGSTGSAGCISDSEPEWRPVEEKVVFVRSDTGCGGGNLIPGIWQVDPDTAWSDGAWPQGEKLSSDFSVVDSAAEPVTSQDGKMVAYARHNRFTGADSSRIHLIDANGDRQLSSSVSDGNITLDTHPSFSANGRYAAFAREIPPMDASRRSGIFRIGSDGTGQTQITESYSYYQQGGGLTGPDIYLTVSPKRPVLKKGRPLRLKVQLHNQSDRRLTNMRLCAKTGRRIVKSSRRCVKLKGIDSGGKAKRTFGLRRHGKAGNQGWTKAEFRALGGGASGSPSASVKIRLR